MRIAPCRNASFPLSKLTRSLLLSLVTLLLMQAVTNPAQGDLIVFGDSLSDTGNYSIATYALTGTALPLPPYSSGRFSNGPLWVEVLADRLGQSALKPSLAGGTNYAFNGARVLGTSPYGTPDLATQVNLYLFSGGTPGSDDLFVIWGGANDMFFDGAAFNPSQVATNLANLVAQLADAGARDFVIPNLPPLGSTPFLNGNSAASPVFNYFSQAYNSALAMELDQLSAARPELQIHQIDVFGLFSSVLQNPTAFGLTNVTTAAAGFDPITGLATGYPIDVDTSLFIDGIHPTMRGHEIVGEFAAQQVVPEPASMAIWALLAGTGALVAKRRKTQAA